MKYIDLGQYKKWRPKTPEDKKLANDLKRLANELKSETKNKNWQWLKNVNKYRGHM